jgi:hypothetical protein
MVLCLDAKSEHLFDKVRIDNDQNNPGSYDDGQSGFGQDAY